jgi:hypothetical protein
MLTIIKLRDLFADLSERGMAQVLADWKELVGIDARSTAGALALADGIAELDGLVETPQTVVETRLRKGEEDLGPIDFVFPSALVIEIVAEVLMIPESGRAARAAGPLSENDAETFREMAGLLCGSWNRVFEELRRDVRVSQSVADLRVRSGAAGERVLRERAPGGRLAHVPLSVQANGREFQALLAIPFEVAIEVAQELYEE